MIGSKKIAIALLIVFIGTAITVGLIIGLIIGLRGSSNNTSNNQLLSNDTFNQTDLLISNLPNQSNESVSNLNIIKLSACIDNNELTNNYTIDCYSAFNSDIYLNQI